MFVTPYVIYLRKSRADLEAEARGEGETLMRHRSALLEVAQKQKLFVTEIYSELVSGETIGSRPVMQKLLAEVEQGVWEGVLVMDIDRLARGDTIDQGVVAQAFKYSDTKIITPLKSFDPNNEFDEEYFEFGLYMSRREYKTILRRMQRGRVASVKEGKYVGNKPPYGYQRIRLDGNNGFSLEPIPEQAEAVQLIFNWYTQGTPRLDGTYERLGFSKIARKLDDMGFPTIAGGIWSTATINGILTNPVYIGKVTWNKRPQVKHVLNGKISKERPRAKNEDWVVADGLHQPLISQDIFNSAQTIFKDHLDSPTPKNRSIKNPLAKVIVCGLCGRSMVRRPYSNGYPDTLLCPNRACQNVSSFLYLVEDRILLLLEKWLKNYKLQIEVLDLKSENNGVQEKKTVITRLSNDLKKLELQQNTLYDFLEQGVYTTEIFLERSTIISKSVEETRQRINSIQDELTSFINASKQKNVAIPKIEQIVELYKISSDPKEKNDLLRQVVDHATYVKFVNGRLPGNSPDDFTLEIYPKLPL